MWWDTRTALAVAVTWLFGLTLARRDVEMFMTPEDKNKYYVEEGGSISITCNVVVDKNVKVDLKWTGPSINSSEPQRLSNNPQGELEKVGNMLSVNGFNNKTAGQYICLATLSPGIPMERTIELVKKKTEESDNKAVVIGVPVGVIGPIFLAGVIVLIWYLRKKNMCCKKNEKKVSKRETYKDKNTSIGEDENLTSETRNQHAEGELDDQGCGTDKGEREDLLPETSEVSQPPAAGGNRSMTEDPHSGIEMSEASQNRATSVDGRTDEDEQKNLLPETSKVSQTPATVDDGNNEAVEQLEQKLEEQRQKYEQDLGKVSAERDDFKGKWEESGRKIDELQKLIVHVNEKLKKVEEAKEEQWQATQHEIEGYKKEIEGYKKELDELTAERDDFKSKWEETNRKHDQLVEQIANLTKEVNELKETKCDQEKVMQLIREYKDEPPAIDLARKSASKDEETCSTDAGVDLRL